MKNIEETLLNEVATILTVERGSVSPHTPLHSLGMDSLRFVELLVFIENQFSLNLMDSGLAKEDFETIDALAKRIAEKL